MFMILALRGLKQNDYSEFETNLTREQDPVSKKKWQYDGVSRHHHRITSGHCCVQVYEKYSFIIAAMCFISLMKLCCMHQMVSTISDLCLLILCQIYPFPSYATWKCPQHCPASPGREEKNTELLVWLCLNCLPALEMGIGPSPSAGGALTLQPDLTQVGKDLKTMWFSKSVILHMEK